MRNNAQDNFSLYCALLRNQDLKQNLEKLKASLDLRNIFIILEFVI